jgi:hypothetical protein
MNKYSHHTSDENNEQWKIYTIEDRRKKTKISDDKVEERKRREKTYSNNNTTKRCGVFYKSRLSRSMEPIVEKGYIVARWYECGRINYQLM